MNTYGDARCAKCSTINLVDFGDQSDQTAMDVESFRCFKCGTVNALLEENDWQPFIAEDQESADEDGKPMP